MSNQQNNQNVVLRFSEKNTLVTSRIGSAITAPVAVRTKINHIIAIDCSGSMYGELPAIRKQLKSKLPTLVREGDTVTIIAFSGPRECVTIITDEKISTITDLSKINAQIDRYLKPTGMTSFKQPLDAVGDVVKTINRKDEAYSMLFLTDGYDNASSESTLVAAVKKLEALVTNAVFIEYGYYCNSALLNKLAEEVGGQVIFSEGFDQYDPMFVSFIQKDKISAKKIAVKLDYTPKYGLVYALDGEEILAFKVNDNNEVLVSDAITAISYLTDTSTLKKSETILSANWANINQAKTEAANRVIIQTVYALIYVLAQRLKTDDIYDILGQVGDAALIQDFSNAFGKQALVRFQNDVLNVVKETVEPFSQGYKANMVPREDAYCVLNLFGDLSSDEGNMWFPSHPSFVYKAIGSKKAQASTKISDAEITRINELTAELASAKTPDKLAELTAAIAEIQKGKHELKFVNSDANKGQAISSMVWNETRPNVSFLTMQHGTVELPDNKFGLKSIDTFRYRNYTFIKDGLVNVAILPASLTEATFNKLLSEGLVSGVYSPDTIYEINLTKLPVINRSMVKNPSAKDLFQKQFYLTELKAMQSVFNYFTKLHFPKKSEGFALTYGPDAADWLKEIGITDYNSFGPKVVSELIGEKYMAKYLEVKIKGLSSLPTTKKVEEKMLTGKALTPSEEIMRAGIQQYMDFTASLKLSTLAEGTPEHAEALAKLKIWLETIQKGVRAEVRKRMLETAVIKFGVIVGQCWFDEFETLDEGKLILDIKGRSYEFNVEMSDEEVEI